MPATPTRIGFVLQEFRTAVAADSAVKTRYGELARDTKDEPVESFFDSTADALVMTTERLTLLKRDARRFRQETKGVQQFSGGLAITQVTPTVQVIDDERQANHPAAVVEIAVDLGGEKTTFTSWG